MVVVSGGGGGDDDDNSIDYLVWIIYFIPEIKVRWH